MEENDVKEGAVQQQEQQQQQGRRRRPTMFRRKFARSAENKLLRLFSPNKQLPVQHSKSDDDLRRPQAPSDKEQQKKKASRHTGDVDDKKSVISNADSSIFLQSIQQRSPELYAMNAKPPSLPSPRHSVSEPLPPQQEDEKKQDEKELVWSVDHWEYAPENHVYARKVVNELSTMQKECRLWLAQAPSPMAVPPGVVLEWPRNWTFSST